MFYVPYAISIPQVERQIIEAYLEGDICEAASLIRMSKHQDWKLHYIITLIETLVARHDFTDMECDSIAVAGASHCLPVANRIFLTKQILRVHSYYYLDFSIKSCLKYPEQTLDFFSQVEETKLIITAGGLDLYDGGYSETPLRDIEKDIDTFFQILSAIPITNKSLLPILPSLDIPALVVTGFNALLSEAGVRYGIPVLPSPRAEDCVRLDRRHFFGNYLFQPGCAFL